MPQRARLKKPINSTTLPLDNSQTCCNGVAVKTGERDELKNKAFLAEIPDEVFQISLC